MKTIPNNTFSIISYTLNKFCPLIIITVLSFIKMGFETFEPYIIIGLVFFIQHFSYKVGYAVAICEERGILDKDD
jgi:hypothetical protein